MSWGLQEQGRNRARLHQRKNRASACASFCAYVTEQLVRVPASARARVDATALKSSKMVASTCAGARRGLLARLAALRAAHESRARRCRSSLLAGQRFIMPETSRLRTAGGGAQRRYRRRGRARRLRQRRAQAALGQGVGGLAEPTAARRIQASPSLDWAIRCCDGRMSRRSRAASGSTTRCPYPSTPNGLLPPDAPAAAEVAAAGVLCTLHDGRRHGGATVALNAADPDDARRMLSPPPYTPAYHEDAASAIGDVSGASFGGACEFIAALSEAGVETTVTAVATPTPPRCATSGRPSAPSAFKERTFLE